ncbi:MAG: O-antigen ligase family protein [Acidimicrobiales bacterium]
MNLSMADRAAPFPPAADEPLAPTDLSPKEARTVVGFALFVVVGLAAMHRSFGHIGIPALNFYIAEATTLAAVLYRPSRMALFDAIRWMVLPGRLHVLSWSVAAFIGYGLFQAIRGYRLNHNFFDVLKTFTLNYYTIYLFLGLWAARVRPDLLRRFVMWAAWVNASFGVIFVFVLRRGDIALPFSDAVLSGPRASAISILGILCFVPDPRRYWYLIAANFVTMIGQQVRAEWIGFTLALLVWSVLTRRVRPLLIGAVALLLLSVVISALNLRIQANVTRGGYVTPAGVAARMVAPFNEDLAEQLAPPELTSAVAGTADWRQTWWKGIWRGVNQEQGRQLLGYGYGYELRQLGVNVEEDTRTPHSVFFFALGYTGFVGVALFALLFIQLGRLLLRVHRLTGNPFGISLFTLSLAMSLFDNFFETPLSALPFYALAGACLAPLFDSTRREGERAELVDDEELELLLEREGERERDRQRDGAAELEDATPPAATRPLDGERNARRRLEQQALAREARPRRRPGR